jgi:hypothetical protein
VDAAYHPPLFLLSLLFRPVSSAESWALITEGTAVIESLKDTQGSYRVQLGLSR